MAHIHRSESCCGVRELGGLEVVHTGDLIRAVYIGIYDHNLNGAFYWFADPVSAGNGQKLADYIEKYELGAVVKIEKKYNPQSRRQLEMWVWRIDVGAIDNWVNKFGEEYKDENFICDYD